MPQAGLIAWILTAGAGLYLLTIWLIEYDREFQSAAATRLPVPVISAHALLAMSGLVVWGIYLLTDTDRLAWLATFILAPVALFGFVMAARWIVVYRTHAAPAGRPRGLGAQVRPQLDGGPAGTAFSAAGGHHSRRIRRRHHRPGAADHPGRRRKLNGSRTPGYGQAGGRRSVMALS